MAIEIGAIEVEEVYSEEDLVSLREYSLIVWRVRYRDGNCSPERFSICESTNGELKSNQGMPL